MGAGNSKPKNDRKKENDDYSQDPETENMKMENVIDYIATKYITQSDFNELQNLHKSEYCNKLVILTSSVIKQFLNDIDIEYLDQRTRNGLEINKMFSGIGVGVYYRFGPYYIPSVVDNFSVKFTSRLNLF